MKKSVFTFIILAFTVVFVYGQTDKGSMYLGGSFNLGFGSEKNKAGGTTTDGPKTFNFGINPSAGYFIGDNLMIGLGLGYDMSTTKQKAVYPDDPDETKITVSAFNVGPFIRYYIMPVKNAGIFCQGNIAMGFGKLKNEVTYNGTTNSTETKMSAFVVGITPGIVFFVSDKVAFEATFGGLNFTSSTDKVGSGDNEVKTTSTNFGLDINPSFFTFGVALHCGK